jgi:hypothetical protein
MEFKPGIFQMDESTYRPLPFLNASSIPYLLQSPAHYLAMLSQPRTPSKEMNFGTALHMRILEPEKFSDTFVVKTIDGRTLKGKAALLEIEHVQKKKIISEEDFERIKYMEANIRNHDIATSLLSNGHAEQVAMFKLKASNGNKVMCKAKIDYIADSVMIDLKTTKCASIESFSKSLENYNYHIQASFYSHSIEALGYDRPKFYFIAVESEPPFAVSVIELSEEHYVVGYGKIYETVDIYEKCLRENNFPSYEPKIYKSRMSKWLR